jgi:3D (Asp-Asp-Asp) domain-containing protein
MTPSKPPVNQIQWHIVAFVCVMLVLIAVMADCNGKRAVGLAARYNQGGEKWVATHYCNCKVCTGKNPGDKAYGITASGKKARDGYIACNWLPIGTLVIIDGKPYRVMDRGAKSEFGDKKHHLKRVDIWMSSHKKALQYGRKTVTVSIPGDKKP